MISDNFFRANFRRFCKRNLFFGPRRVHHALSAFFRISQGAGHHISHTVDKPDVESCPGSRVYSNRFRRYELWFCCGYGLPFAALGKFVSNSGFLIRTRHIRKYQHIHKSSDESRFSRADGTDDTHIYVSSCPLRDILID